MSGQRPYAILVLLLMLLLPTEMQGMTTLECRAKVVLRGDTVPTVPEDSVVRDSVEEETLPEYLPRVRRRHGEAPTDTATVAYADSLCRVVNDTLKLARFNDWKPDPIRAMWLGMVFPGGGQIYNRKYWKLPIVYGGVLGCIYAITWNGQMLRDYSQAYQDITDSDPTTNSYLEMLPMGYDITGREEHFKTVFQRKKNFYRRYRDLSIFFMAGVYVLSVLDAYVDAELSSFDIGRDLSLRVSPSVIPSEGNSGFGLLGGSPGVTFQLNY